MKHLLLTTILGTFALTAQAQVLHDNCWDHSFAYNYMTVTKGDHMLEVNLKGSTIFNVSGDSWDPNTSKSIEIPLDKCQFSTDNLLMNCNVQEIDVTLDRLGEEEQVITLDYLIFDISFVESAGWSRGFSLNTKFQISGATEHKASEVFFGGDRQKGCMNRFGK